MGIILSASVAAYAALAPSEVLLLALPLNILACLVASISLLFFLPARVTKKYLKLPIISTGYLILVLAAGILTISSKALGVSTEPVMLIWPSLIVAAGLFSAWLPAAIAIGLTASTVLAAQDSPALTLLGYIFAVAILPMIIASIIRFAAATTSRRTYRRRPQDYKKPSSEITRLIDESAGLIRALGDGVLAIDSQELVRFINPAAERLLGWAHDDGENLQYQSVLKLAKDDGSAISDAEEPIKQTLNTNQEARASSLQLETKNGKKIFVAITVSPLGDPGSGVVAIFRDITRDVAEGRQQAEFISTASHEMRTPVASIEGYLGLALNPNTAQIDDKARDFITKAHESAQHLGRLFQDLLDVSKSEDGRLKSNPRVFDVVKHIEEAVKGLQPRAAEKGLSLVFKPSSSSEKSERKLSPVLYVNLDQDHMRELVSNLTENAIKYTPSGQVSVDVRGVDGSVEISIEDTGVGIPEEDIPHLFQKFYRVDNTDTREIGGTGLGLFLARRLAESLDGTINVKSAYKQGSTFTVTVPRIEPQAAQQMLRQQQEKDIQAAEQAGTASTAETLEASPAVTPVAATSNIQPATAPTTAAAPVNAAPAQQTPTAPITPTPAPVPPTFQPASQPAQTVVPQATQAPTTPTASPAVGPQSPVAPTQQAKQAAPPPQAVTAPATINHQLPARQTPSPSAVPHAAAPTARYQPATNHSQATPATQPNVLPTPATPQGPGPTAQAQPAPVPPTQSPPQPKI